MIAPLAMALVSAIVSGCDREAPAQRSDPQPDPPSATPATPAPAAPPVGPNPMPAAPEKPGPAFEGIAFFQAKCAMCHGPYAEFAGSVFGAKLDRPQLRQKVSDMVTGQSRAKVEPAQLDVLTAYVFSLRGPKPYVSMTADDNGKMRGEVTPGSTVTLVMESGTVSATVVGHVWNAQAPKKVLRIEAERRGAKTVLDLATASYSHGKD